MSGEELDGEYDEVRFKDEEEGLNEEEKQYKVELLREINRRLPDSDPKKLYSQDIPPETNYEQWRIEFRNITKMSSDELFREYKKVIDVENYNGLTEEERKYERRLFKLLNKNKQPAMVERIPEELRFIKRFINLNGKTKRKDEILRFINSLQKAIVEKRIRITSKYADQIRLVQDKLIEVYNTMKGKIKFELKPETIEALKALVGEEKMLPSIGFIKRYIGMNGRTGMKEKAKQLLSQINRAMDKGRIGENDPYTTEIHEIKKNLKSFTTNKAVKTLKLKRPPSMASKEYWAAPANL